MSRLRTPIARSAPLATVLSFTLLCLAAAPASASLVLASPDETSGTGLGAVNTVLTIQNDPTESGCVGWNGTSDVVGPAACPPDIAGGDETAINETRSLGELGLSSAYNLRVVFNYNEDNADSITLEDLHLTIYAPDGTELFDSGAFVPQTFPEPFSGTGNAGFVFRLDATQAAQAQAFFDDPDNRIGLAAAVTQSSAGPETFFVAEASALGAPAADLSLTKTDSVDPATVGVPFTYTLTVTNDGPNRATGVTVTDTLPASVTFQSATPSQGTCTQSGRNVVCDLGALAEGDTATIDIVVTPQTDGIVITNSASVSGDQSDPAPSNNQATETTDIGAGSSDVVNLALTKTDSPDPVAVGSTLTYTLTVDNIGMFDADGVTVTDTLPATMTFQSATPDQGSCSVDGRVVTCDLGTVPSTGSVEIDILVTPTAEGTFTNTATVSADQRDVDSTNNNAVEETTVGPDGPGGPTVTGADLSIIKTDASDPVVVGGNLVYSLVIDNAGPSAATNVQVIDDLPDDVTFESADPSQGTCSEAGGLVTCDLGTIPAGGTADIAIRVTPTSAGTLLNTAAVSADQSETDPTDNSDDESTVVEESILAIPTASEWGLLLLALLLGSVGVLTLGRRF